MRTVRTATMSSSSTTNGPKETDDVAGAARHAPPAEAPPPDALAPDPLVQEGVGEAERREQAAAPLDPLGDEGATRAPEADDEERSGSFEPGEDEEQGPPPPEVAALAEGCVRFVAARYAVTLDYEPDTLSFVDQWVRDARAEMQRRPEAAELVQSSAGAYLGEVMRRSFGGEWVVRSEVANYRLCMASVYCAFNPIGMAREALLLEPAEGWHAHFELDSAEREAIEERLEALPEVPDEEYYAPSTRYDVTEIVIAALQGAMQQRGLTGVVFTPADYGLVERLESRLE
jgi:hypothetical protein